MNDFFFGFDTQPGNVSTTVSLNCETCGLCSGCDNPKMGWQGDGKRGILIVNDHCTPADDANGEVLYGETGRYLERLMNQLDLDLHGDFWRINAVQCFPNHNGIMRQPSALEMQCCRVRLHDAINELKPKAIITMGINALNTLIGDKITGRIKAVKWTDFFGACIPEWSFNAWLCPTYNPLFFRDNRETRDYDMMFKKVFVTALEHADEAVPNYDPKNIKVDLITDPEEVKERILRFIDNNPVGAFDYETNSIKAQGPTKRILCTSISNGKDDTFCFPHNEKTKKYLRLFLTAKDCGKIAHNATFEHSWSKVHLGVDVNPWAWDTAIGAHCVNSQRSCGLKLQSYLYFGIIGYDADVDEYIESSAKAEREYGANALNRIFDAPLNTVMRYCGIDSWLSARLMPLQKQELRAYNPEALAMAKFYTDGAIALGKMHIQGMNFDTQLAARNDAQLTEDINALYGDMYREYPSWNGKTSGSGLLTYLRDDLGLDIANADKEVLEETDHPFCRKLLEIRELEKIRDTFISGLFKECVDGKVHCFFNLTRAKTFRSSSTNVNCQNLSKRNKTAKKYIRTCLVPPKGFRIGEIDFTSLEIYTSAFVFHAQKYLEYCLSGADQHTDVSCKLLGISHDEWDALPHDVTKNIRTITKTYNFSNAYGGSAKSAAKRMYGKYTPEAKKVLAKQGLKNYEAFERRLCEVDQWVWGELYGEYGKNREQNYQDYLERGYIENPCGFRFQAPISFTESTNVSSQSLGANIKVSAVIDATNELERRGLKSRLFAEIHDALICYIADGEEIEVWNILNDCMVNRIHDRFPVFNLNLKAEIEMSELAENGGNWANMYDADKILFYNYNHILMNETDKRMAFVSKYLPNKHDTLEDAENEFFGDYKARVKEFVKWQGKQKFSI